MCISHTVDSTKPDTQAIQWDFKHLGRGTYDEPTTMVYLVVSGIKHEIQKIEFSFGEVNRESYMDYQIPQDALIACRGWWAGAGIDYWVIKKENKLVVFSRELGETITDKGEPGDYMGAPVEIKTITLP